MDHLNKIENQIQELQKLLTGDMMTDMDIRDKIHKLEMQLKKIRPDDSSFECVGCGS
ncbi:MAG: hypothetical protein WAU36_04170 [Cyclobacteriaceae bacterium]